MEIATGPTERSGPTVRRNGHRCIGINSRTGSNSSIRIAIRIQPFTGDVGQAVETGIKRNHIRGTRAVRPGIRLNRTCCDLFADRATGQDLPHADFIHLTGKALPDSCKDRAHTLNHRKLFGVHAGGHVAIDIDLQFTCVVIKGTRHMRPCVQRDRVLSRSLHLDVNPIGWRKPRRQASGGIQTQEEVLGISRHFALNDRDFTSNRRRSDPGFHGPRRSGQPGIQRQLNIAACLTVKFQHTIVQPLQGVNRVGSDLVLNAIAHTVIIRIHKGRITAEGILIDIQQTVVVRILEPIHNAIVVRIVGIRVVVSVILVQVVQAIIVRIALGIGVGYRIRGIARRIGHIIGGSIRCNDTREEYLFPPVRNAVNIIIEQADEIHVDIRCRSATHNGVGPELNTVEGIVLIQLPSVILRRHTTIIKDVVRHQILNALSHKTLGGCGLRRPADHILHQPLQEQRLVTRGVSRGMELTVVRLAGSKRIPEADDVVRIILVDKNIIRNGCVSRHNAVPC